MMKQVKLQDEFGFHDVRGDNLILEYDFEQPSKISLNFDGTDDYCQVNDHNDFSFTDGASDQPFSIAADVVVSSNTATKTICSKWNPNGKREWAFNLTSNKVQFYFYDDATNQTQARVTDSALSEGRHTIVCTYDGTGGGSAADNAAIYVDGVEVDSTNTTGTNTYSKMTNSTAPFLIGSNILFATQLPPYQCWDDAMYALRMFDVELSAGEIADPFSKSDDLIGNWNFQKGSGSVLEDKTGSHNATITGATWSQGNIVNSARKPRLDFDGVDDTISVPPDSSYDINGSTEYSIEALVNVHTDGENSQGNICFKDEAFQLYLDAETGGVCRLRCSVEHSSSNAITNSNGGTYGIRPVPTNAIAHIVAVYNRLADKTVELYVNGNLQDGTTTIAGSGNIKDDSSENLYIGNNEADDRAFDGEIYKLQFYRGKALTAAEVTSLYNNEVVSGASAAYTFGSGSGATLVDHSGNGNDGTITGATWTGVLEATCVGAPALMNRNNLDPYLSFDGVDDYARVADTVDFENVPFSFVLDFEFETLPSVLGNRAYLLRKTHGSSPWQSWRLSADNSSNANKLAFSITQSDSTSFTCTADAASIVGVRQHVVGTYDASGNLKLYIDGVLQADTETADGTIYPSNSYLNLGSDSGASPGHVKVYKAGYFKSALSQDDVDKLYAGKAASVDPYSWWGMGGSDLSVVADSMKNQDLTTSGCYFYQGQSTTFEKRFLAFSGSEYLQIPDDNLLNLTDDMTFVMILKTFDSAALHTVLFKGGSTPQYAIDLNTSGMRFFGYVSGVAKGLTTVGQGTTINDRKWHVIICVKNGSDWKIDFDGVEDQTDSESATLTDSGTDLFVGYRSSASSDKFTGGLGLLRIYNRALSAEERAILYRFLIDKYKLV